MKKSKPIILSKKIVCFSALCFVFLLSPVLNSVANGCAGGRKPKFAWEKRKERQQSVMAVLNVCPMAQVTRITCSSHESEMKGQQVFDFKVHVKNASKNERCFCLDLLKAGDDHSSKGPLSSEKSVPLKPGEEDELVLPMDIEKKPERIVIKVENQWSFKDAPGMIFKKCCNIAKKIWCSFREVPYQGESEYSVSTIQVYCRAVQ